MTYETDLDVTGLGYLHAHSRNNPLTAGSLHVLIDGVAGHGHDVGSYLAWGVNAPGWWGEGEFKVYLDGDEDYPTICGTGTEDYFGGAGTSMFPAAATPNTRRRTSACPR